MNIIEIKPYDVVNGPGIRTSIWIAGCNNKCKGCWSPNTWDPNQGINYFQNKDIQTHLHNCLNNPNIQGISILGGDPFYNFMNYHKEDFFQFVEIINNYHKPIWVWTGYTFEDILNKVKYRDLMVNKNELIIKLKMIDVLIDGKFEEENKDLTLYYRGSSNQRIINVPLSIANNEIITLHYK